MGSYGWRGATLAQRTVLELTVENHPGVMAAVCGRFAARGFNLEGIICLPEESGLSRMWLLVRDDDELDQVVSQLWKMVDVVEIHRRPASHESFVELEKAFRHEN